MSRDVSDISTTLEQLTLRMQQLEDRLSLLESERSKQPSATNGVAVHSLPPVSSAPRERVPETWQGFPTLEFPAVIPILGKAVIGLAGAYLFRALAETGTLPKFPIVVLAIAYAMLWMIHAIRVHKDAFASVTYSATSILILSPMLWETTVRFEFMSPAYAGAILVGFFAVTIVLAMRHNLETIPWLAAVATTGTALALFFATRNVLPLTCSILAIAGVMEVVTCSGRMLSSRMIPAIASSVSVLLVLAIMTFGPPPENYPLVGPATLSALWFVLLAIYVGSIGVRGFWRKRPVTAVDVIQGTMVFTVAVVGATRATDLTESLLGLVLLALAAGCYWAALVTFGDVAFTRNRRTFSGWAVGLLIAGSIFVFRANTAMLLLCVAAAAASLAYRRVGTISLGLHASVLLGTATVLSSLPAFMEGALVGTMPAAPDWTVLVVTVAAVLCYAIGSSVAETKMRRRALWVVPAVLSALAAVALVLTATVWVTNGHWEMSASRISVIRTVVNCALALTLGFLGPFWRRIELGWVAYAAVAFGSLKLMFEDLRFGSPETLVFSFLFYGVVLIVLPRLTRRGQTDYQHPRKYFVFSA